MSCNIRIYYLSCHSERNHIIDATHANTSLYIYIIIIYSRYTQLVNCPEEHARVLCVCVCTQCFLLSIKYSRGNSIIIIRGERAPRTNSVWRPPAIYGPRPTRHTAARRTAAERSLREFSSNRRIKYTEISILSSCRFGFVYGLFFFFHFVCV